MVEMNGYLQQLLVKLFHQNFLYIQYCHVKAYKIIILYAEVEIAVKISVNP